MWLLLAKYALRSLVGKQSTACPGDLLGSKHAVCLVPAKSGLAQIEQVARHAVPAMGSMQASFVNRAMTALGGLQGGMNLKGRKGEALLLEQGALLGQTSVRPLEQTRSCAQQILWAWDKGSESTLHPM